MISRQIAVAQNINRPGNGQRAIIRVEQFFSGGCSRVTEVDSERNVQIPRSILKSFGLEMIGANNFVNAVGLANMGSSPGVFSTTTNLLSLRLPTSQIVETKTHCASLNKLASPRPDYGHAA